MQASGAVWEHLERGEDKEGIGKERTQAERDYIIKIYCMKKLFKK